MQPNIMKGILFMTIQSLIILNELRKIASSTDTLLSFVSDAPYICIFENPDVFFDYSKYSNEIQSIIKHLIDNGYLVTGFNEMNFQLTQKGLHPFQAIISMIISFLFRSILVPIVVAILTTLVTLWLKELL